MKRIDIYNIKYNFKLPFEREILKNRHLYTFCKKFEIFNNLYYFSFLWIDYFKIGGNENEKNYYEKT